MPAPTQTGSTDLDLTAAPRAVLRESVRLLYLVMGEKRLGTARANAWAAVCADRDRARARDEINRVLAATRADRPGTRPEHSNQSAAVVGSAAPDEQQKTGGHEANLDHGGEHRDRHTVDDPLAQPRAGRGRGRQGKADQAGP
jgi:hypothetical protein